MLNYLKVHRMRPHVRVLASRSNYNPIRLEKPSETKGHGLRDNQSQRYINIWSTSDPFGLGIGRFQHLCVSPKAITNRNENQA